MDAETDKVKAIATPWNVLNSKIFIFNFIVYEVLFELFLLLVILPTRYRYKHRVSSAIKCVLYSF